MSVLCIYCAGGLGRDLLALMQPEDMLHWKEIVFIDDVSTEKVVNQTKVLTFQELLDRKKDDCEFVILNGEPLYREQLYQKVIKHGFCMGKIIFGSSVSASDAVIKEGSIIHCQSIISSGALIQENVFVGKKAMVGHDVTVGKHSVISACSYVGGWVNIGEESFIGAGAAIRDRVTIGKRCIIGIGSVVTKDVQDNTVVAGNPARVLRMNDSHKVFE